MGPVPMFLITVSRIFSGIGYCREENILEQGKRIFSR